MTLTGIIGTASVVDSRRWIEAMARMGYAAKGVVYTVVGILALQAAMGMGGATAGARRAVEEIGRQPFGQLLLALTAVSLTGYVLWRFVQALLDTEQKGPDALGLVQRAGYLVSGFSYAILAYTAALILFRAEAGEGRQKEEWTAMVLGQPFGPWLVGGVGVVIIGVGLYHFYRVYKARFMSHYEDGALSAAARRWARGIGRFGLGARGVTFALIGIFFIQAAVQANAEEVKGLGGALQTLAAQPYGLWLLGVAALGFVAYGLYCFSRAWYRRFETR